MDTAGETGTGKEASTAPAEESAFPNVAGLQPDEILALREMLFARMKRKRDSFEVPEFPITDADRDRFADCILRRKLFSEECEMLGGKLKVKFRVKTKRENDVVFDQIDADMKIGRIGSETKFVTLLNNYNLMTQMVELNDVKIPSAIPPGDLPADFSLYEAMRRHMVEDLADPHIYLLIGALSQFDQKVKVLSQEALKANFSKPAAVS